MSGTDAAPRAASPPPRAIVLVSGGLDSAVTLAEARARGFACYAMSFRYGQRHEVELAAAARVARALGAVEHKVVAVDLRAIGGSSLTDAIEVPKDRADHAIATGIPSTYVPCRNLIFLALAAGWAEAIGASALFLGVNAIDYSGYPDCREPFLRAVESALALGTRAGVEGRALRIEAPLVALTKAEIIRRGVALGVDLGLTTSCYDPDPDGRACGRCDSCHLRRKGFAEADVRDPTRYV